MLDMNKLSNRRTATNYLHEQASCWEMAPTTADCERSDKNPLLPTRKHQGAAQCEQRWRRCLYSPSLGNHVLRPYCMSDKSVQWKSGGSASPTCEPPLPLHFRILGWSTYEAKCGSYAHTRIFSNCPSGRLIPPHGPRGHCPLSECGLRSPSSCWITLSFVNVRPLVEPCLLSTPQKTGSQDTT